MHSLQRYLFSFMFRKFVACWVVEILIFQIELNSIYPPSLKCCDINSFSVWFHFGSCFDWLQWKGFSPLCFLKCIFKRAGVRKALSHIEQICFLVFIGLCSSLLWRSQIILDLNFLLHWSQLKLLSLCVILLWLIRDIVSANTNLHTFQWILWL